jgi:hypothetical protein
MTLSNGNIAKSASIYTADKYIWVDNTSLRANGNSTIQFYVSDAPLWFKVDASNDVSTNLLNVTRYNGDISVNGVKETHSMSSAGDTAAGNILDNKEQQQQLQQQQLQQEQEKDNNNLISGLDNNSSETTGGEVPVSDMHQNDDTEPDGNKDATEQNVQKFVNTDK